MRIFFNNLAVHATLHITNATQTELMQYFSAVVVSSNIMQLELFEYHITLTMGEGKYKHLNQYNYYQRFKRFRSEIYKHTMTLLQNRPVSCGNYLPNIFRQFLNPFCLYYGSHDISADQDQESYFSMIVK